VVRLEDLNVDAIVEGLSADGPVRIIRVDAPGPDSRKVFFEDRDGNLHQQVLFRSNEATLRTATEKGSGHWSFSADPERFKLGVEAHRIRLAYLFDPMMAVHAANVEPLPHQISAVYEHMLPKTPLRYVLADDPGAGKTIMAGLLISELILRAAADRVLIVAPGSLVVQWQEELKEKFELEFDIFSNEMQNLAASRNAFEDKNFLIARLDQLSRNEDYQALLERTRWDLIVVDEAHKMSASFNGNKLSETRRFKLGKLLGGITRHFLLMTATPHNGKETDFQLFLSLLDEDRFYGKFRDGASPVRVEDLMRRMVKEDLLKFDGSKLFPERRAYTVNYQLSDLEAALYEQVTEYVRNEMNRAERLQGRQKNTVGFALTLLQRRLASSPEAIYQSLKRRRERLLRKIEELRAIERGHRVSELMADYAPWNDPSLDLENADEELTAEEYEALSDTVIDQATAAQSIEELELEINTLESLEAQAAAVVHSKRDRKWEELSNLLQENPQMYADGHARRKLIIFTEHKDTLHYLLDRIRRMIGISEAVIAIHGGTGRDERLRLQEAFRQDPRVLVLVATDAAGEGVNLQNAHLMINYDLPWNPNRIEQRFGRIHRIGQQEICHLWNLVAAETREGQVFQRLFDKLEIARAALGGRVFDILGEAFEGTSLRELIIQAIRSGDDPIQQQRILEQVDEPIEHQRLLDLMERNALVESQLGMEQLYAVREQMEKAEARKLQPMFIRSFFERAFSDYGGQLRERESGRFQIPHVPARILERDRKLHLQRATVLPRYERVCFEKKHISLRGRPQASLIHPGHPLMQSVTDLVIDEQSNQLSAGAVLVDPSDFTTEPRLLFMLEHRVRETAGAHPRVVSQRLQFVQMQPDGNFSPAGWAPHLSLLPPPEEASDLCQKQLQQAWLQDANESSLLNFAAEHLVPEHYDEVQTRRKAQIDKTKQAVKERLQREIDFHSDRYQKLLEEVDAGRQPRVQPENARREVERLSERLRARLEELDAQRELAATPPRVLSAALVLPQGLIDQARGELGRVIDVAARKRVERVAMDAVIAAEKALGHQVRDVSAQNIGWDITSQPSARDGVLPPSRHIEVKGRAVGQETITVTSNEIREGINQGDRFFLAVVLVDGEQADGPYYIRQPFDQEPGWAEASRNFKLRELLTRAGRPERRS
jgi:SNF2 family DNA or RNA helicase